MVIARPKVLIVEDEFVARMAAAEMIEEAGYEALEAGSADEAISILEQHSDIRAVVTDIQIPGSMDGLKLAHAVKDRWPPIKIITTSGRPLPSVDLPEAARFLPKPYSVGMLFRTLGELIGA